jgi:tetratricopeptide (TPR) repeat protein
MSRGLRVLIAACILIVCGAIAAVFIWQTEKLGFATKYMFAVMLVVVGATFTILHLSLSDDLLRRHFGEQGAVEMRRAWRGGWIGVLLGAALLGLHYVDRQVAQAQFTMAFNRGLSAYKDRNWQATIEAFSEAIRLDPSDVRAYRQRGAAYLHQEEHDRAIADFNEALRLAPDDAGTVYNRGVAYAKKQEYDSALTDFREAIRLDPAFAKAYRSRSKVYAKKGDDARAMADKLKAAELEKSGEENP